MKHIKRIKELTDLLSSEVRNFHDEAQKPILTKETPKKEVSNENK